MPHTEQDILNAIDNAFRVIIPAELADNRIIRLKNITDLRDIRSKARKGGTLHSVISYKRSTHTKGLAVTLKKLFEHVKAGRSSKEKLKKIYVIPQNTDNAEVIDDSVSSYTINNHKDNFKILLEYIAEKAHRIKDAYMANELGVKRADVDDNFGNEYEARFVLVGPKGIGKTILLNYCLSTMSEVMDDLKLIWIRVDLTKPLRAWTVQERFQHQALLIFKEKYLLDQKREVFNKSDFRSYLFKRLGNEKEVNEYYQGVINTKDIPDSYFHDEHNSSSQSLKLKIQNSWFKEVQNYCIYKEYAFLYILDGLDKLRPDSFNSERFDYWLSQAESLFYSDHDYIGAFIYSMRESSYNDFLSRYVVPEGLRREPKLLTIAYVDPNAIYDKRFENASVLGVRVPIDIDVIDLGKLLKHFVGVGIGVKDDFALKRLHELFSGDNRNLMRALSFCVDRLIYSIELNANAVYFNNKQEEEIATKNFQDEAIKLLSNKSNWEEFCRWKGYEVMESLVNGNHFSVHNPFAYTNSDKNGYIIKTNMAGKDAGFFPNLFNYSEQIANTIKGPLKCLSLMKIRILQYLKLIHEGKDKFKVVFEDDLVEIMHQQFGFHPDLIKTSLHELEYFGTISFNETEGRVSVDITESGKYCIDRLVYDHTYLMNVVENSPLPRLTSEFFEIIHYDTYTRYEVFAKKIRNLIAFLNYLEACEKKCSTTHFFNKKILISAELKNENIEGIKRIVRAAFKEIAGQEKMRQAFIAEFKPFLEY